MRVAQADLFATPAPAPDSAPDPALADSTRARIRGELARVRAVAAFEDAALLRELMVEQSLKESARWLPPEEAKTLIAAYEREMERLFAPHLDPA